MKKYILVVARKEYITVHEYENKEKALFAMRHHIYDILLKKEGCKLHNQSFEEINWEENFSDGEVAYNLNYGYVHYNEIYENYLITPIEFERDNPLSLKEQVFLDTLKKLRASENLTTRFNKMLHENIYEALHNATNEHIWALGSENLDGSIQHELEAYELRDLAFLLNLLKI